MRRLTPSRCAETVRDFVALWLIKLKEGWFRGNQPPRDAAPNYLKTGAISLYAFLVAVSRLARSEAGARFG
jgi:hypothetical protein